MAVTLAEVSTPNSQQSYGEFLGFKAKIVQITLDSSQLDGGEPLTAAQLGWDQVYGAIVLSQFAVANGDTHVPVVIKNNAANTQLTIQAYRYNGASAGVAFLEEAPAADLSTYSGKLIVLGA